MRTVQIGDLVVGITRLRDKAGANPQSLFDLVNGFVTGSRSTRPRPSSKHVHRLPPGTKGLTSFQKKLWVFAPQPVDPQNDLFRVAVTMHPDDPTRPIQEIHFADAFLGFLYVVVEFAPSDNDLPTLLHYWLQSSGTWKAETVYLSNDIIEPTVQNGLAFSPTRTTDPAPFWQPGLAVEVGDRVSPSVENGYEFIADEVLGNATTGSDEPAWPAAEGACVFDGDDAEGEEGGAPSTGLPASPSPNPTTGERYGSFNIGDLQIRRIK